MGGLLIALLVGIYTAQFIFTRYYSASYPGEGASSSVFTVVSGIIAAALSFAVSKFCLNPSLDIVFLGIGNAIALVLYNTSLIKASTAGPYSITMVTVISGGIVIPAIAAVFLGDSLSWVKIASIAGILISVYLISKKEGEVYQNKKLFWLCCAGVAIGNGAYSVILDVQNRIAPEQKQELIAITFAAASVLSLIMLWLKEKNKAFAAFRQTKKSLVFLLAASLVVGSAVNLITYILELVDTTLLYTLNNSCVFLITTLFSMLAFGEKLSKVNVVGCVTICVSLVFFSIG